MNLRPCIILAALCAVLLTAKARAEMEFVGLLTVSSRTTFILKESAESPAVWRPLGGQFAGFKLESFDAKTDTLTLTKPGATQRLRLKDAKVLPGRFELNGTLKVRFGQEQTEARRIVLPFGVTTPVPAANGLVWQITPKLLPDGNWLFEMVIERTGEAGKAEKISAPKIIVLPHKPFALSIGELEFAFTPVSP